MDVAKVKKFEGFKIVAYMNRHGNLLISNVFKQVTIVTQLPVSKWSR